jgi:hypothetical protein
MNKNSEGPAAQLTENIAHAWEKRYHQALDELFGREHITIDEIADTVLEKGILDRVAPLDEKVLMLRKKEGRLVWEGGREDPDLHGRLLYSFEHLKHAIRHNHTLGGEKFIGNATLPALVRYMGRAAKLFPDIPSEEAPLVFIAELQNKISRRLVELGASEPPVLLPGTEALFHGIPVIVEGYSNDGYLVVKGKDRQSWMRLFDVAPAGKIPPEDVGGSDFVVADDANGA